MTTLTNCISKEDLMECLICIRVRRGADPEDALDQVVERHARRITDDPPLSISEVRAQIVATCCGTHAASATALDDAAILETAEWDLIDRLERLNERAVDGASDALRGAAANLEARLERLERLKETTA